jgi:hypothetical protein
MACKTCASILGKYARAHPCRPCPLGKALYCSICSNYGHTRISCKFKEIIAECPDILNDNVLPEIKNVLQPCMIEITDADAPIRAALLGMGVTPMVCQEKGKKVQKDFIENKRRLIQSYKEVGLTLVLVTPKKIYTDD